jgi:pseudouridine synthase
MEAKPERLQKILAAAGLASRRKAEEMISAGLVSVNGEVITEPGTKADPRLDEIRVEGKLLRGPERHVYIAIYKPKGYMTTVSDPEGRPTVMDLLKGVEERVFPVGRLDYMSEGLLLLTNDGDLMSQLTRAGSHVPKTYMVKVSGKPSEEAVDKLRDGIMLPPEPGLAGARGKKQPGVERRSFAVRTQPAAIQLAVDQENPWFEVTITEGRNRQLRRMFEQIGHHIEKIKRVRYGSLTLDLEPGEFRYLTPKEVNQLRRSLEKPFTPKPIKPKRKEERKPRLDSARFVKGRRGKPSAEGAEAPAELGRGAEKKFASRAGAASASSERRPFGAREDRSSDRGPARRYGGPRGPEFGGGRSERGDQRGERGGGPRPFSRRPGGDFAPRREEGEEKRPRRTFSKPNFAGEERRGRPSGFGGPESSGGREGFGSRQGFSGRPQRGAGRPGDAERRPTGGQRGDRAERGERGARGPRADRDFAQTGSTGDRRFSKGPGKPQRPAAGGRGTKFGKPSRAAGGPPRDRAERGEPVARGPRGDRDFAQTGSTGGPRFSKGPGKPERSGGGRGTKFGKPSRAAGGEGRFKREGREGGFKREGGAGFKRPEGRGGQPPGGPRPPRRRPGEE